MNTLTNTNKTTKKYLTQTYGNFLKSICRKKKPEILFTGCTCILIKSRATYLC